MATIRARSLVFLLLLVLGGLTLLRSAFDSTESEYQAPPEPSRAAPGPGEDHAYLPPPPPEPTPTEVPDSAPDRRAEGERQLPNAVREAARVAAIDALDSAARPPSPGRLPVGAVLARLDPDPRTGERVAVAPGRAPPLAVERLLRDGLGTVLGTVSIEGERTPEVEAGVPVSLTGRVVELESGRPVRGAEVVLHSAFYLRRYFYDHHLKEVARAETNADGEFRIERLNIEPVHFGEDGMVFLTVSSPDHATLLGRPLLKVAPGCRSRLPDLVISRERHEIRGRVLDRWEGKPVVGARVVATGAIQPIEYPKDQREVLFLLSPQATTDEEGRFVLRDVGAGPQMLSVHGGDDCAGYQSVSVPHQGELLLRTRQIRGRIEGRILDARDRPITLVMVEGGENSTHTFADGSFVLENFRGDVLTLVLTHPDYRTKTVSGVQDGSTNLLVRLDTRLPEIRFRVRDHGTGAAIPLVRIEFKLREGMIAPPGAVSPLYHAEDGVHAVRVPGGAAEATFTASGHSPVTVELGGLRDGDLVDVLLAD